MQIQANGTYNHSMMVAQLAEAACREIGANSLLARVGAYFHDIGKMDQSEYFVENQANMENKHNDLNPTLSASVIKSHVRKGVEKAHQLHLPQAVIDIIAEHHGNSIITYFYNAAKDKDSSLDEDDFRYPGIPPVTKESAVVMLADTVEAACRTLDKPSVPRLEKFIKTLIDSKIEHHQLENCNLTFRDIAKIQESFVQTLAAYYHSRTKYPDQKDPDAPQQTSSPVEQIQNQTAQNEAPVQQKKTEEKSSVSTVASASTAGVVIKKTRTTAAKTKAAPVKKVVKEAKQ
jgi:putative nucleotidyltransferase with HDIG domain